MLLFLRTVGWLFAIVLSTVPSYWFLVHPRAEYWRSRSGPRLSILGPLWIAIWIAVGAITWPWRYVAWYDSPFPWLAAAPFFAIGFYLYHRGRARFSFAQLLGRPEVEGGRFEQRLVTTGIRARVRHPVYLGHLCELIGWSLGTGLAVIYGLTAFAIVTGAIMVRMEDSELEGRFGQEFREYRARVPAVVPSFRSRQVPIGFPPVEQFIAELIRELPKGAATVKDAPERGYYIVPSNPDATTIWLMDDVEGYNIGIGEGTVYEWQDHLTFEEVHAICTAVIEGRFEETIWKLGSRITKTVGVALRPDGTQVGRVVRFFSLIPFRRGVKQLVRYAPYTLSGGSADHAL